MVRTALGVQEFSVQKDDLWCGYCGTQEFIVRPGIPKRLHWVQWECVLCHALYEDNSGYGYFTADWGNNPAGTLGRYCLNSGELIDESKLPRTPEGIVGHSGSQERLEAYLGRTQVQ